MWFQGSERRVPDWLFNGTQTNSDDPLSVPNNTTLPELQLPESIRQTDIVAKSTRPKGNRSKLALRIIRRILRRLDGALDHADTQTAEGVPASNGLEDRIAAFVDSIAVDSAGAAEYLRQHRERICHTLSHVAIGHSSARALELGSYLQMAAALEAVLGYPSLRCAYYGEAPASEQNSIRLKSGDSSEFAVDLFDAERHTFPYESGSLDLILCCELIEHLVKDPMHMVLECRRVLREGGTLIITTPNIASLKSVAQNLFGDANPQIFSRYNVSGNEPPHVREYTPHELQRLMTDGGFAVDCLFTWTERSSEANGWVLDVLRAQRLPEKFRGEQIFCRATKAEAQPTLRYPGWLYAQ